MRFDRKCNFEGCRNHQWSKGFCSGHVSQLRLGKKLKPLKHRNPSNICSVEGCGKPHTGKGLCAGHLFRKKNGKSLEVPLRSRKLDATCTINNCSARHEARGLCHNHLNVFYKNRSPEDTLSYRLRLSIRSNLRFLMTKYQGKRKRGSLRHLSYTVKDLKAHLEALFHSGISWDNFGKWDIDHIIPLRFKNPDGTYYWNQEELADPTSETFKKAWALSNLQPLTASENRSKSNRYIGRRAS